jgi:glucose-1-phosphate thymidylyltransferase
MKGIILAGGTGSRLSPLTKVTNKHLLPIYDRPMIYYPIMKLREMGITQILLVSGKGHAGHFLELLGSGSSLGVDLNYEVQEEAGGIAQAIGLAEDYIRDEKFVVMLGDNIYEDDLLPAVETFKTDDNLAHIFLKEVANPSSYGVAALSESGQVSEIIEKPENPPSSFAVTGCYLLTPHVFEIIRTLKPSGRGELEISHVNDKYVKDGVMGHTLLKGFWGDCGESIDHNMRVANHVYKNAHLWASKA